MFNNDPGCHLYDCTKIHRSLCAFTTPIWQIREVTCPKAYSWDGVERRWNPGLGSLKAPALPTTLSCLFVGARALNSALL
jgi:hypothetical protein